MKKYFTKQYAKLSAIAIAIMSLGFVIPMPAYAAGVPWYLNFIGLGAILSTLDAIGYFIGFVAGLFVFFGGTLVNWTLDMNSQVLTSNTVQIGWVVSRDIANLGFVLAIILIAFITILRLNSYDTKQMLWKLIIATLLINFSLVFAGLFVDFSGVLTNFFVNKATSYDQSQLGPGLANAFQTSKILQQTEDENKIKTLVTGIWQDPNAHFPFTASIFFVAFFTTVVAISLISLSAMLFMRYIWLTMLLILMPIAWLFWAWPDLSGQWSKWWSEFLRWCLFAPAMSFFLYLALSIAEHPVAPIQGTDAMALTFANFGQMAAQMISVLGILYGGMYTANKMSIDGSGAGMMVANKVKGYMTGAGGYVGERYGLGGLNRLSTSFGSKQTINERLRGATAALTGVPLVGTAFQSINQQLRKSGEENVGDWIKHYDAMTPDARKNAFQGRILNPDERAGAMASMAKNGQMRDMQRMPDFDRYAQMAINRGGEVSKTLISKDAELAKYKVNPDDPQFRGKPDSEITIAKKAEVANAYAGLAQDAVKDVSAEALTANVENLAKVRPGFLSAFGEYKDYKDKNLLVTKLGEQIKNLSGNIKMLSVEERGIFNNLSSKLTFMAKSPAWAGYISDDMKKIISLGKKKDRDENEE